MMDLSARFFSDLPVQRVTLSQLLADEGRFAAVPPDWHVIVTDIENSTAAVQAGRHELVNLVATGSIIATLNLAHGDDLLVPFFFGGDGATLLVPPALLAPALSALAAHRENTRATFDLTLRVGSVPVADLYASGHTLAISRLRLTDLFAIPVVLGHALAEAERRIKGYDGPDTLTPSDRLDLHGMECRWDRIEPAERSHEVVSLLVVTPDGQHQAPVFKRVVDLLDTIYGAPDSRNPISLSRLRLKGTLDKLATETRARLGRLDAWALARTWLATRLGGRFYLRSPAGQRYLGQLVELTDTLVIDGRINTVIAGSAAQRERLEAGLAELEAAGRVLYGLAVSRESVMSCYVSDRTDKHSPFVDGAEGGYTLAAGVLKRKLRAAATPGGAGDASSA
ncbi:MAG: DUF3095 family protein [Rubricoccaceae bacterium]|nr:DUF3095 family protein [Rubricoccaceae bacterium]